jgi:LacI family transcriptional regulator
MRLTAMKKATTKDIARLAGVSQTTVSFVLNSVNDGSIPDSTRTKILEVAQKLNYTPRRPKRAASKTGTQKIFGVLVPTLSNLIYPLWIQEIEKYASSLGFGIIICNTCRKPENEALYLKLLAEKKVDGIVFVFNPSNPSLVQKISQEIPFFNIAEKSDNLKVNVIGLDSVKAGEIMAQHLIDLGHKNIAYISTPLTNIARSRVKRLEGITAKMKEHGFEENLIVETDACEQEDYHSAYEIEIGYSLAQKVLSERKVSAIVGINDMVAIGAINAIKELDLEIPEDVSVCGFDNIFLSSLLKPKLTTIDHHLYYRAKHAIDLLIEMIDQSQPEKEEEPVLRIEYEPQLIVRESTGPAREILLKA